MFYGINYLKDEGDIMKKTFATKIKKFRKEAHLSQEQLANICKVSVQAVSKWECCLSYPDIELLPIIAKALNVTIDSLLLDDVEDHETFSWDDDDKIRVVQYHGHQLLAVDEITNKINLKMPSFDYSKEKDKVIFNVEVAGDVQIDGSIGGNVSVNAGAVSCQKIGGNLIVSAGAVCCQKVGGNLTVTAGNMSCQKIEGNVNVTHGDIECKGNLYVEGSIECDNINVTNDLHCKSNMNCNHVTCNAIYKK